MDAGKPKNNKNGRMATGKRRIVVLAAVVLLLFGAVVVWFFLAGPGRTVFKDPVETALESSDTKAQKGDTAGAVRDLDAAAARTGNAQEKATLYVKKSDIQSDAGNDNAAAASAQQAVDAAPSENTYRSLGLTLAADGQNDAAIDAYKKALAAYDAAHPDDRGQESYGRDYYIDQIKGLGGSV